MRQIYEWFRTGVTWLVLAIIAAVLGEFGIEIAREHGFYTHPTETVGDIVSLVRHLPWFLPTALALAGFVGGMWLDTLVLRHVRGRQQAEDEQKSDLEIWYDETSKTHARYSFERSKFERLVGVRNRGSKTVMWVSVRARDAEDIRIFNDFQIANLAVIDVGVIYQGGALDPGATEFFEIECGPPKSDIGSFGFYNHPHRFILEARARDVLTVRAEFEYDPSNNKIRMLPT